MKNKNMVLTN